MRTVELRSRVNILDLFPEAPPQLQSLTEEFGENLTSWMVDYSHGQDDRVYQFSAEINGVRVHVQSRRGEYDVALDFFDNGPRGPMSHCPHPYTTAINTLEKIRQHIGWVPERAELARREFEAACQRLDDVEARIEAWKKSA